MAYACRTPIVLVLLGLFVASTAHRAAAAELPFTILDQDDWYGSSGSMCENVGAPPDEMRCIATADYRLLGQRLLLDFGQPVALSSFAHAAPPGLSNERETLYALATPNSSLDLALAEISVTQVNDLGLHAEFPAVVARYVLWRVDATYETRREGTSFWSTVIRGPNGLTDGLRFYGEPVAVPEPSGLVLLVLGLAGVCCSASVRGTASSF